MSQITVTSVSLFYCIVPGLLESPSVTLLAFDEVEEREGDDVTTMLTPGEGDGFTETRRACNLESN